MSRWFSKASFLARCCMLTGWLNCWFTTWIRKRICKDICSRSSRICTKIRVLWSLIEDVKELALRHRFIVWSELSGACGDSGTIGFVEEWSSSFIPFSLFLSVLWNSLLVKLPCIDQKQRLWSCTPQSIGSILIIFGSLVARLLLASGWGGDSGVIATRVLAMHFDLSVFITIYKFKLLLIFFK